MTDTNTAGTTVATINPSLTENEMALMTRIANFIISSSDLHVRMPKLEAEIATVSAELQRQSNISSDYANQLIVVGHERDEAQDKVRSQTDALLRAEMDHAELQRRYNDAEQDYNDIASTLKECRKDRDEAQFQVLTLTEEVTALRARLDKFKALLADEPTPAKEPEPMPEPVNPAPEAQTGYVPFEPDTSSVQGPTTPVPVTEPTPTEIRVYLSNVGQWEFWQTVDNTHGLVAQWDNEKPDYYYIRPASTF